MQVLWSLDQSFSLHGQGFKVCDPSFHIWVARLAGGDEKNINGKAWFVFGMCETARCSAEIQIYKYPV